MNAFEEKTVLLRMNYEYGAEIMIISLQTSMDQHTENADRLDRTLLSYIKKLTHSLCRCNQSIPMNY